MKPMISLDFGRSNTSIAMSTDAKAAVIPNNRNKRYTPSLIAFSEGRIFVGEEAMKPSIPVENVIYGMKRYIGTSFLEESFADCRFKILENDGKLIVETQDRTLTAEEVVGLYFMYIKDHVESDIGPIGGAVLTIPSSFRTMQCRALQDIAYMAGFPVTYLIPETKAAAINFALENIVEESRIILIFQMGGGSVDVAVFEIVGASVELLASVATDKFGGEDFDRNLLKYVLNNSMVERDANTLESLQKACENAKIDFGLSNNVKISIDHLRISTVLTKQQFEFINRTFLLTIKEMINTAILGANKAASEINHYFFIGRSTRMPSVIDILKTTLGGGKRRQIVDADEAAVKGAAQYAEHISGGTITNLKVCDNDVSSKYQIVSHQGKVTVTCVRKAHDDGSLVTSTPTWHESLTVMMKFLKSYKVNTEIVMVIHSKLGSSMADVDDSINKIKQYRKEDKNILRLEEDIGRFHEEFSGVKNRILNLLSQVSDENVNKRLQAELLSESEKIEHRINSENTTRETLEETKEIFRQLKNKIVEEETYMKTQAESATKKKEGSGFFNPFTKKVHRQATGGRRIGTGVDAEIERLFQIGNKLYQRITKLKSETRQKGYTADVGTLPRLEAEVTEMSLHDLHTHEEFEKREKDLNDIKKELDDFEVNFRETVERVVNEVASSSASDEIAHLIKRAAKIHSRAHQLLSRRNLDNQSKNKVKQYIRECENIMNSETVDVGKYNATLDGIKQYLRGKENPLNEQTSQDSIGGYQPTYYSAGYGWHGWY